jgi:hypothetical protein
MQCKQDLMNSQTWSCHIQRKITDIRIGISRIQFMTLERVENTNNDSREFWEAKKVTQVKDSLAYHRFGTVISLSSRTFVSNLWIADCLIVSVLLELNLTKLGSAWIVLPLKLHVTVIDLIWKWFSFTCDQIWCFSKSSLRSFESHSRLTQMESSAVSTSWL